MRFIVLLLLVPCVCSAQSIELQPLTITKSSQSQSLEEISNSTLQDLAAASNEEIANYSSNVQVTSRAKFGLQQDVSIRGSGFEDASITLFGVSIKDPQTGHYSLEIPLTSADIDAVNISSNSQEINFVLKRPKDKGGLLQASFGQHALWANLLSVNFALQNIKNRVSVEHKISKGARADTDFDIYNFSYDALWQKDATEAEFIFGSTQRDFGADSFYSSRFTQEEEHINQRFFSLRTSYDAGPFILNDTFYLRRHRDKYILNRFNPSFYTNYHTNYTYGFKNEFEFRNNALLGMEIERQTIDSTNLAKHYRLRKGLFAGIKEKKLGRFIVDAVAGLDYYDSWRYLDNEHFSLGYQLCKSMVARFSFDRIWRVPSFTELFYSDPANRGDPNLAMQRSNNFEWSLEHRADDNLTLKGGYFLRKQANTIDWVKNNSGDPWQAINIGDVDAHGFDALSQFGINMGFLENVSLGYTYLALDRADPFTFSKYVFDYNRHKVVGSCGLNFFGTRVNLIANFVNPIKREKYVTADIKIEKAIDRFTLALEGTNIFNTGYEEMTDIPGAGRWYMASITYSF